MRNKEKYIGVFDSGIGGLTVVKHLLEQMPNENIVYLGDSKHMPYGDKTNEQIIEYAKNDVDFLSTFDLKAIVIACNTSDSIAYNTISENYDVPVFGVIEPAAKQAVKLSKNDRIGIIATSATIKNNEYVRKIAKFNTHAKVFSQSCPFLAPMIEEGKFDINNQEIKYILEDYLTPLIENDIDTLILGCTHYDLLTDIVKQMYPKLNIVSSSKCVIDYLKNKIEINDNTNNEQLYFVTADKEKFKHVSSIFMGDIEINQI